MTTVENILRARFNYTPGDFGEGATVNVDSGSGTISPIGEGSDCELKNVRIVEIIKPGVHVRLAAAKNQEKLFAVLTTNKDGVTVLFKNGSIGFLPWYSLSHPLSTSSSVEISGYDSEETDNLDRELARSEINHLLQKIREHKDLINSLLARVELLTVKLQEPTLDRPSS